MVAHRVRWRYRAVALFLVFVLSAVIANGSLAQTLSEDLPGVDDTVPVPPIAEPITNPPNAEEGAIGPAAILAAPAALMNYQGVLKDADGRRLTGAYDMVFRLYNAAPAGGTKVWGDETHADVPVDDGLFAVVLGETVPLDTATDFDEQLYLEVSVAGVVLPRQPLRAAPYAMGLVVGANVRGATAGVTQYGLRVENTGGRGVYVNGAGDNVYGVYDADVTYAEGGYAGPDTYVWLPAQLAILRFEDVAVAHLETGINGNVTVRTDVADELVDVELPIVWERPYGRDYELVDITVYYSAKGADGFITAAWLLGRNMLTGANVTLTESLTDRTTVGFSSFTFGPDAPVAITEATLPTNVQIRLDLDAAGDYVRLYGVRLRLRTIL